MKKIAYTLAEVLITLSIIGIIAAVVAPSVSNIKPDYNKAMYLKACDTLSEVVKTVARNSEIYPAIYDKNGNLYDTKHYPFLNDSQGLDPAFKYNGNTKLAYILSDMLAGEDNSGRTTVAGSALNFKTDNGIFWGVDETDTNLNSNPVTSYTKVIIDVNGMDEPNSTYTPGMSKRPDQFIFYISAGGHVIPGDVYGQMFLDRRKSLKREKNELEYINSGAYSAIDPTNDTRFSIDPADLQVN